MTSNSLRPNRRILLVDDLPAIHGDYRKILLPADPGCALDEAEATLFGTPPAPRPPSYALTSVYHGMEALVQVQASLQAAQPYAMAFIDRRMLPGGDGLETIERLWRVDPRLQVVICTAQADPSWDEVLERLDSRDRLLILKKPFEPIEVRQLASTLTAKWQATEDAQAGNRQLEAAVAQRTRALQASQDFSVAIFDSMAAEIAVLDREGVITACNEPWQQFATQNGAGSAETAALTGVGVNYLAVCRAAPDSNAAEVCRGIEAVLDGSLAIFSHEYPCHSARHQRWFGMRVTRLEVEGGGAVVAHVDLTEQKRVEAALRASQAFLDKTGRIGGVGGWELDIATQSIQWTAETCRIHDLPPDHVPTLEEGIRYYAPEARPVIEAAVHHCMETGEGFDLELPFITAAGRAIWVRTVGEPERVCGSVVRVIGAFQDISARRALEAELRQKNDLVSTVLANLPCGLSVFDNELNVVLANTDYRRMFDLPDEIFERPALRFEVLLRMDADRGEMGSGDTEAAVQAILDHARTSTPQLFERRRRDGTLLEIRTCRLPDGGLVATYIDITPRRRAEAEARRSTELLRGAIEAIDEAFVLYDPQDRLVLCNEKYRDIYAKSADVIVAGARFEDIVRIGAERGQYAAAIGRVDEWVRERLKSHTEGTGTVLQKLDDGRTLRIVERRMPDGHLVGFRIDITDLVRASEAAQAASLAKSQFLANMSHELRTPMNAILGMLTLLGRTPLTPRQADYAGKSEGAARSLLGLLNEILDFSKVEAGKMTLDPQAFDLQQMLGELSPLASANLGEKPIELLLDVDVELPAVVQGDAMRLKQVLLNLLGNALKFTSAGEVVLAIKLVHRDAHKVTIDFSVSDTGIGIAADNQAHIFNGFSQAEASTTRRFGGTGLGLAISRQLVGLMGGELALESTPGEGSRFHFRIDLPTGPDDESRISDATYCSRPPTHPLRALVVDDHPGARSVLANIGRKLGWHIHTASGGEQALDLLTALSAPELALDAIFIDDQMPGLNGWETNQCIRAKGLHPAAVLLLLTSSERYQQLAQRSEVELALLDGFVVKPVTAASIRDAVEQARQRQHAKHNPAAAPCPLPRRLDGLRLLLAEDNPNNQQVARELLVAEGALVELAQNGSEAVDAVREAQRPFDAVLMDLQMPVMDGFTATLRIRNDLGLGPSALPIVAMTANAMPSDRQACLAAGMNDHVGKPFDLAHLVDVLREHTGRRGPAAQAAWDVPHAALPAPVLQLARAAEIDLLPAVRRLGGRLEVYQRMVRGFVAELPATAALLRPQIGQPSAGTAPQLMHTLKGLAATLGIVLLAESASRAEKLFGQAARRCGVDATGAATREPAFHSQALSLAWAACRVTLETIARATPGLLAFLQVLEAEHVRALPPPRSLATAAFDAAAFEQALGELTTQLQDADMAATTTMDKIEQRFGAALGERLQPMASAVAALDFVAALQCCGRLTRRECA